jgi:hypothetical protein
MSNISNRELFSVILSSRILEPYLAQNSELAEMMKAPDHPDIHYFERPAPASEIAPSLKHRLGVMVEKNISHNLEATSRLVAFMQEHPDSLIYNVTFNCSTQHYGVRCGWAKDRMHVICVMTGGHIPDQLLGESAR